ncbi:uncharacterized protein [Clytia hemisphaerica]|uniref:Galaxin-like repeats domain-containing protein n=1 Tax=Clytia hemisphaerica TaxID=252671 RepID=A0A7M5WQU1_9CNID
MGFFECLIAFSLMILVAAGNNNNNNNNLFTFLNTNIQYTYCGWQIMDASSQLCCNNNLYNALPYHRCCGSTTYNSKSQKCYRGKVYSRKVRCGRNYYDPNTEFCVNYKVFNRNEYGVCRGFVLRRAAPEAKDSAKSLNMMLPIF